MTHLESLALLIADLNAQVRALQAENAELHEQVARAEQAPPSLPDGADGWCLPNRRRVYRVDSGEYVAADEGGWLPGSRPSVRAWLTGDDETG